MRKGFNHHDQQKEEENENMSVEEEETGQEDETEGEVEENYIPKKNVDNNNARYCLFLTKNAF